MKSSTKQSQVGTKTNSCLKHYHRTATALYPGYGLVKFVLRPVVELCAHYNTTSLRELTGLNGTKTTKTDVKERPVGNGEFDLQ
eukprot:2822731-Rhodomonas_salina.1